MLNLDDRSPTKEELLSFARWKDTLDVYVGYSALADNFIVEICEYHGTDCTHAHDAFSLALDGEDVDELL